LFLRCGHPFWATLPIGNSLWCAGNVLRRESNGGRRKGGRDKGRKGGREEGRKGGREEGRKGGREEGALHFSLPPFLPSSLLF
jgi:hypothetical protein